MVLKYILRAITSPDVALRKFITITFFRFINLQNATIWFRLDIAEEDPSVLLHTWNVSCTLNDLSLYRENLLYFLERHLIVKHSFCYAKS